MFTNPIIINTIDLSSLLEGLNTISQVLSENAKDRTMLRKPQGYTLPYFPEAP